MITFERLAEKHLTLLHSWLNQPHVRDFYQRTPITLEETNAKYLPRVLGREPVNCHIILSDGVPFGKIQCYKLIDYPESAQELGVSEGIGLDLFIGDPAYLHKGLGRKFLKQYILEVAFASYPGERNCYIAHSIRNAAALACSDAAGFQYLRDVVDEGEPSELLVYRRSDQGDVARR